MLRIVLIAVAVVAVVAVACLALLLTGSRILIWETKVEAGERLHVDGYGEAGGNDQATLVCRYFTGRGVTANVFWYSPNNVLGRDSCPFLDRPQ